ncbi:MAG: DUF3187 family protein [Gammaproteobacteria bacterium]
MNNSERLGQPAMRLRLESERGPALWATGLLAALVVPVLAASPVDAETWFPMRNHNPFLHVFGMPVTQPASLQPRGSGRYRISLDVANHAEQDQTALESGETDGESYFLDLAYRYGLRDGLEVGIDVPLVAHSGGFLDGPIERWHDLWGLSNSRRSGPRNQVDYRYVAPDGTAFRLSSSESGIGDVRLGAALRLGNQDRHRSYALRAGIKLPTGDADTLLGSGATDYHLSLHADDRYSLADRELRVSALAGILLPGDSDTLPATQEGAVGFGGMALAWQASDRLSLMAQVNGETAYYDSDLEILGGNSVQLTVGGAWHARRSGLSVRLGIVEDLFGNATSDFAFQLAVSWRSRPHEAQTP